jgi:hypothetical protein
MAWLTFLIFLIHLFIKIKIVSRLFWVSSLAYPNLLGTKGYVVVVVVEFIKIKITKV